MEWKDCSSYSQGDTERTPSDWRLRSDDFTICVHRHIHYPKDQWLLSCDPFYNKYPLKSKDIEKAKEDSLLMVLGKLTINLKKMTNEIII